MAESKTSPRRLKAVDKQREALELRKSGWCYADIAEKLGYTTSEGAYQAVKTALDKMLREPAEECRKVEDERLNTLFNKVYDRAKETGEDKDITQCLAIMNRRARLLGLDAPTKVAPTTPDGNNTYTSNIDYSKLTVDELLTVKALLSKAGHVEPERT